MPYYNYDTVLAYDTIIPYNGYYENTNVFVSVSIASAVTFNPSFEFQETILRLYDGYPRLQDVITSNPKITVIGSKIAYKLTSNFWTTRL